MWQLIGHNKAITFLQRSLETGALAHAYLLVGPPQVGKMTLAVNLAQALNCEAVERPCGRCPSCQKIALGSYPDVQVVGLTARESAPDISRKEIGIDQVREIQHAASLPPFEGKYKLFIIDGAELMSTEAANCLLKTLEEPPARAVFVLLTTNDKLLLPTVVSRCQRLELPPVPLKDIEDALEQRGIALEKAKLLARLSHGCPGWAILASRDEALLAQRGDKLKKLLELVNADLEARFEFAGQLGIQFNRDRESVQAVLDLWQDWWRDVLLAKLGQNDIIINRDYLADLGGMAAELGLSQIRAFIESIQAAGRQLRLNANPRLVLEVLMLDMPGKEGRGGVKPTAPVVLKNG